MSAEVVLVQRWQWERCVMSEIGPASPSVRLALMAIPMRSPLTKTEDCPSQALIAKRSGLSERQVKRVLSTAEAQGWVERIITRRPGRSWYHTIYRFAVPASLAHRIPTAIEGSDDIRPEGDIVTPRDPPRGVIVTSRRGADGVTSERDKVTSMPPDGVTNGHNGVTGWPTKSHSEVPLEVPSKKPPLPPEGARVVGRRRSPERQQRERAGAAYARARELIDEINGSNHSWAYVATHTADDPLIEQAIAAVGGHRRIADRDRLTRKNLKDEFLVAYIRGATAEEEAAW